MSTASVGVLLALSGEDSEILRALNQSGSGVSVVRRCADLPELLSAGMAGLAPLALLDTGFDEVDRTVLDRLGRAGLAGVLLVEAGQQERWRSAGWPVERRDAPPARICSLLQSVARASAARSYGSAQVAGTGGGGAPTGQDQPAARSAPPLTPRTGLTGTGGPGGPGPAVMSPAEETAWLEELWQHPSGSAAAGAAGGGASTSSTRAGDVADTVHPGPHPGPSTDPGEPKDDALGRLVVVWGTHGAPGRSTVATSLACGLARAGGAVLVDADVEAPCLVQLLGMPDDSSALAGAARLATHGRLDAESFSRLLVPAGPGLALLGGLGRAGRWRELPPPSMSEVWLQCRRSAGWTVVDVAGGALDDDVDTFTLEPGRCAVAAEVVASADVVVVVGAADPVGVRRLVQLLGESPGGTPAATAPAGRVEVVVNRVRASAAGPSPQRSVREAMERYGGLEQVVLLPEDAASADRCLLEGRSVLDGAPASELGRALAGLVDRVDPRSGARDRVRRKPAAWRLGRRPGRGAGEGSPGRVRGGQLEGWRRRWGRPTRQDRPDTFAVTAVTEPGAPPASPAALRPPLQEKSPPAPGPQASQGSQEGGRLPHAQAPAPSWADVPSAPRSPRFLQPRRTGRHRR